MSKSIAHSALSRSLVLLTALTTGVSALAAPGSAASVYKIDKVHSEASFRIRHLVTKVRGRFEDLAGTITMDMGKPANSSVTFTIQAISVNTFNDERDTHLRSADFFNVEKFKEITFTSSHVAKTGDDTYDVTGTLTMRGVAREITLPVVFLGEVNGMQGAVRAGFTTETQLDRKDFGINWNAALDRGGFVLGDDVLIEINLETVKQQP